VFWRPTLRLSRYSRSAAAVLSEESGQRCLGKALGETTRPDRAFGSSGVAARWKARLQLTDAQSKERSSRVSASPTRYRAAPPETQSCAGAARAARETGPGTPGQYLTGLRWQKRSQSSTRGASARPARRCSLATRAYRRYRSTPAKEAAPSAPATGPLPAPAGGAHRQSPLDVADHQEGVVVEVAHHGRAAPQLRRPPVPVVVVGEGAVVHHGRDVGEDALRRGGQGWGWGSALAPLPRLRSTGCPWIPAHLQGQEPQQPYGPQAAPSPPRIQLNKTTARSRFIPQPSSGSASAPRHPGWRTAGFHAVSQLTQGFPGSHRGFWSSEEGTPRPRAEVKPDSLGTGRSARASTWFPGLYLLFWACQSRVIARQERAQKQDGHRPEFSINPQPGSFLPREPSALPAQRRLKQGEV